MNGRRKRILNLIAGLVVSLIGYGGVLLQAGDWWATIGPIHRHDMELKVSGSSHVQDEHLEPLVSIVHDVLVDVGDEAEANRVANLVGGCPGASSRPGEEGQGDPGASDFEEFSAVRTARIHD